MFDPQQPRHSLSKTQYQLYRDCPRHLWTQVHLPELWPEPTPFETHTQEQGYVVEARAQAWLEQKALPAHINPSGTPGQWHWQDTFVDGEFYCRVDGWWEDPKSNAAHVFEIKSSTRVKYDAITDLAYQVAVIEATKPVESIWLIHLNREYVRAGEIDLDSLFVLVDVTAQVRERMLDVKLEREEALNVLKSENSDEWAACTRPKVCPCQTICHPDLPEYSVFDLPGLRFTTNDLLAQGIKELADVPDNFPLETKQRRMVEAVKTQVPVIDRAALSKTLGELQYPLCFLDYEAYSSALPLYDACHPQQQVVFQYSLHIVPHRNAPLESEEVQHIEFISFGPGDPSIDLVHHMQEHMPKKGSVIVWNESFEATRNREMAEGMLNASEFLLQLNNRMVDLAEIFRLGVYVDREFHGSWSIKNVLPVLAPDLSYHDLPIHKGDQALLAWWDVASGAVSDPKERQKIQADLLQYCALDTWAMVRVWNKLEAVFAVSHTI
jgi:hypothetical protein